MKKLVSLFLALVLLFSAALAEDGADEAVEEIVEDVMLDDEEDADEAGADGGAAIPDLAERSGRQQLLDPADGHHG